MGVEVKYKSKALFSEPKNFCDMIGMEFVWSHEKKLLYIFPMNSKGTHSLRWISIPKHDIKDVIKALQKCLKDE